MTNNLLDNIKYIKSRYFPKKELQTIIENKEEYIPFLIKVLEDACRNYKELEKDNDYFLHIYALYLLAQFKEPKALKPVLALLKLSEDTLELLLSDVITMDLPAILAAICQEDIAPIKHIIEDSKVYEYVRGSAISSLTILAAKNIIARENVINYFRELFERKLEKEYSAVWDNLINECCNLYPEELMDLIRKAYELNLIDPSCISLEDVEDTLRQGKAEVLENLKANKGKKYNINTIDIMSSWYCFE